MGIGSWSLRLNDKTPQRTLAALDPDDYAFGHIIVTPTHIPSTGVSASTLLSLARYTGVYRDRPTHFELGGPGLAMWLGDEDGKGDSIVGTYSANQSFVAWVTAINYAALTAGTYTAIAGPGNLDYTATDMARRDLLDYVCAFYTAEWRITPAGVLDAGPKANLFVTSPEVVVQRRSGGRDINVTGIKATLDLSRDFQDYTTDVAVNAASTTGLATIGASPYLDLLGNPVIFTRIIDSPDTVAAHDDAVAQAQLNRFLDPRKEITLSTEVYDLGRDVVAGDEIYVYDPELGLVDTANEVHYRGQTVHPVSIRCLGVTWPISEGMGVYFRNKSGTVTDLSEWVLWETGATTLEVGALPRKSR